MISYVKCVCSFVALPAYAVSVLDFQDLPSLWDYTCLSSTPLDPFPYSEYALSVFLSYSSAISETQCVNYLSFTLHSS